MHRSVSTDSGQTKLRRNHTKPAATWRGEEDWKYTEQASANSHHRDYSHWDTAAQVSTQYIRDYSHWDTAAL